MGYDRHHAIVVTSYGREYIDVARQKAIDLGCVVSEVLQAQVNDWHTFMVGPDGSNEGWADSDEGDYRRDEFVEWLNAMRFSDGGTPLRWVEVQYGDDELETKVCRHSDEIVHGDDYSGPHTLA